jgi:hypothetical protein
MRAFGIAVLVSLTAAAGCDESLPGSPQPESIEPATTEQGKETAVTIRGRDFYLGVSVSYSQKSHTRISDAFTARLGDSELEDVTYVDFNTLKARVPAGLGLGTHTLTVIDPTGKIGTLRDAFTVVAAGDGGRSDIEDGSVMQDAAEPETDAAVPDAGMDGSMDAAPEPADAAARDAASNDSSSMDTSLPDSAADAEVDDAGTVDGSVELLEYCQELPALSQPPTIDGTLEPGLELVDFIPVDWTGPGPLPAGNSAVYAVAWRPDGIYFFVSVSDPNRLPPAPGERSFYGDGVELYVDDDGAYDNPSDYDAPGSIQYIMPAPVDGDTPSTRFEAFRDMDIQLGWVFTGFQVYPRAGGYVLEAFLQASDLGLPVWSLAAGDTVGFNLAHNVSFASDQGVPNNREGQYFVRIADAPDLDGCDHPYCNVLAFCTPVLLAP